MPLGAGNYRFDLKLEGQKRQTIVPKLSIKPGQFITAQMKLNACWVCIQPVRALLEKPPQQACLFWAR